MANVSRAEMVHNVVSQDDSGPRVRRRSVVPAEVPTVAPVEVEDEQSKKSKTVSRKDLPAWYADNIYIFTGYRRIQNSYRGCFESLGYINNETGNIYSHLIGAVLFLVLVIAGHSYAMDMPESTKWSDHAVIIIFMLSAVTCLGCSATFHTCCCHSQAVARKWNKADYVGIVVLIVGSFIPTLYYGFYCEPVLQAIYIAGISILGFITVGLCLSSLFTRPEYRTTRTVNFIALGLSGVIPLIHSWLTYGLKFVRGSLTVEYLVVMGAMYVIGAVIYACRVPERWFPGKFDIWGHSHQIFHTLVLTAAITHYVGVMKAYHFWHTANPYCKIPLDQMASQMTEARAHGAAF
ncbi:hypothetical protein HK104_002341 [Borealophlyctis nickersoniae]|nr:hypothetical protein HK104_002341 [Borealophlyctis nickersoniae]